MTTSLQTSMNLDEWKESGLQLIKALRVRGEEDAFRRLLSDLYPDTAHFIFELLQNAEDTKATTVNFILNKDCLEFNHNGDRLFSETDVKAITSFGNSTKRDDPTSIGKFGVGFKAVFAYTDTPEIHSGHFHFRIHDLVVPETKGVAKPAIDDQTTRFIFPFDNPKKSANIAVTEIETGLRNLGDNTLLFLTHIRKIDYKLPNGETGSLQRIDHEDGRIDIRSLHPGGTETISHWLHFQKDVEIIDEDGKSKQCNIAIAYSLIEEANTKGEGSTWKIVPLDHGQVSIYFPAEKETSNLRFHLHAPFASTVARDSVRDCSANQQLRDGIAELIVESLISIRDQGLLTIGFLAVLPNPGDNLAGSSPLYEPIRKSIIQAFKDESLTPTRSGGYASADALYRGPARIAEVLNDDDLSLLTNYTPPLWAANPPPQSLREDRFLDSLKIDNWGWGELANSISYLGEERERIEILISGKDDTWLLRFYALLEQASEEHSVNVTDLCIIRVNVGKEDIHVKPKEAFFLLEDSQIMPSEDVYFVKQSVYQGGRSESQKNLAKSFLESAGVRLYDEKTFVQLRLEHYKESSFREKSERSIIFEDIKLFISYWKKNPSEIELFRNSHIFLNTSDIDSYQQWSKPCNLYLDEPYLETGLAEIASIHKKYRIWVGYKEKLNKTQLVDFIGLLKATGVMTGLVVVEAPLYENPNFRTLCQDRYNVNNTNSKVTKTRESINEISEDYNLYGLDKLLELKSIKCAYLIWNALIHSDPKVAKARYRPNSKYQIREADSQLVYYLKNNAWIPDNQGKLFKPQDMTRDDLRDDFPFDNGNGLLTAIGFGENAKKQTAVYYAKNTIAQKIGWESFEDAEKWLAVKNTGVSPDALLAQQQYTEQPEESAPNPERRRKGILERSENVPSKESLMRERAIQPGINAVVAEAKAYLRAKYTNANGETVCQCCQNEMPFKIGDVYYFEAVQCVKGVKNHHIENRLALCPTCAAMYQYACDTDDVEISRLIIEHEALDDASSVKIPVTLAGKQHNLRFVGIHWFDLKTVFETLRVRC
ncbi:MAG: hypothetical protein WCP01_05220 [Methylococcaceae bacterium]